MPYFLRGCLIIQSEAVTCLFGLSSRPTKPTSGTKPTSSTRDLVTRISSLSQPTPSANLPSSPFVLLQPSLRPSSLHTTLKTTTFFLFFATITIVTVSTIIMSSQPENGNGAATPEAKKVQLTEREQEILSKAWNCMKTQPEVSGILFYSFSRDHIDVCFILFPCFLLFLALILSHISPMSSLLQRYGQPPSLTSSSDISERESVIHGMMSFFKMFLMSSFGRAHHGQPLPPLF